MRYLKFIIVVVTLAISINSLHAQQEVKLDNSVLWKIEHADIKEPSYLFGTLHIMCEEDFSIPKKVKEVLQRVDALVLEINLSDPNEMQELQKAMSNPKKISDELSDIEFKKLDSLVTKVTGVKLINYDAYGLSILNSIMAAKMLPCTNLKYLENEITLIAARYEKPIFALEKAAEQIKTLENAYPTEFALKQIMLFESYKKDFNEAIIAYNNEDIDKAVNLITKELYMNENATQLMQIDRNANWVEQIPTMMTNRSNLFAVGAGHLVKEYGLIHLLRQKGFKVTPVIK
nr:TraB/GumN family protein [uncultured Psychroserpens sp.]